MDRNELRERILQYFDGDLSPDEETALAAVLREDAEARKLLGVLARLHAQLPEAMRLTETLDRSAASSAPQAAPAKRLRITRRAWRTPSARSRWARWSLAAAASVFAAAGLVYLFSAPTGGQPAGSGEVVKGTPTKAPKDVEAAPQGTLPPERPSPAGAVKDPGPKPAPIPTQEPKLPPPQRPPAPPLPPAPLPAPPVEPPKPPETAPVVTEAAVAIVEQAEGDVHLVVGGNRIAARKGHQVLAAQGLEVGETGSAVVTYPDRTRLEAGSGTVIREMGPQGRRVFVAKGRLAAQVARQPKDQPMVFATPHGEATVLGTKLRILVDSDPKKGTRLEVVEGKVRLKDLSGKAAEVTAGHLAVAAAGVEPAARSIALVGSWEFEEGTGTTAHDSSGLGNTATLVDGGAWVNGKAGKGLGFDGAKQAHLSVPHSSSLDLGAADESFTVALWYRKAGNDRDIGGIVRKDDANGTTPFSLTRMPDTGRVMFAIVGTGNQRAEVISKRRVTDDAWHHIAAVRDRENDVLRLYIDGVEDAPPVRDRAGNARNTAPVWIARCPVGSTFYHDPILVDEVRILNRALSAGQVARLALGRE